MIYDDSRTRAKNRQKIVDVARELFMKNGIAGTTVIDIVRRAKIERKTFYNYFEDKDEIAQYIHYLSLNSFYSTGFEQDIYDDCETGYQKVEMYLKSLINRMTEKDDEILFMSHYNYYMGKFQSAEEVQYIYDVNEIENPNKYFNEGINDGSIDPSGLDFETLFNVISQSIGSFAERIIFRSNKQHTNEAINFTQLYALLELHLKSIKK